MHVEPSPQIIDDGLALLVADGLPLLGCMAADHCLDMVEGVDPLQGGLGDRGVAALGDLVEPAPDVGPAIGKDHRATGTPWIGQRLVGGVAVDLEDAGEPGQRPDGVLGAAARRIEIGDRRWIAAAPWLLLLALAGLPALSLPCGFDGGVPLGMQVIGPPLADARVFEVAAAIEAATGLGSRVAPAAAGRAR